MWLWNAPFYPHGRPVIHAFPPPWPPRRRIPRGTSWTSSPKWYTFLYIFSGRQFDVYIYHTFWKQSYIFYTFENGLQAQWPVWFETSYDMQNHENHEHLHVVNWAKWSQATMAIVVWNHWALTCCGQIIHFYTFVNGLQTRWPVWFETTYDMQNHENNSLLERLSGLKSHWPAWLDTTYKCINMYDLKCRLG